MIRDLLVPYFQKRVKRSNWAERTGRQTLAGHSAFRSLYNKIQLGCVKVLSLYVSRYLVITEWFIEETFRCEYIKCWREFQLYLPAFNSCTSQMLTANCSTQIIQIASFLLPACLEFSFILQTMWNLNILIVLKSKKSKD